MSFTLLNSSKFGSPDSFGFDTSTFSSVGAKLICGFVAWFGAATDGIIASNHGDTVVYGTGQADSGIVWCRAFWIINPTSDSAYKLTCSGTSGQFYGSLCWAWYSAAGLPTFVMQNGAVGHGAVGNLVPDGDNQLLVAGCCHQLSDTSIDLLTERQDQAYVGSTSYGSSFADEIQTTATTRNPTITGRDTSAGVVFKDVGGGGIPNFVVNPSIRAKAVKRSCYY